jgi:CRP/FNR family transcriptional regulator, cyclic AMP receptor protein
MNKHETTKAREAREKEYQEDARRLREFAAFAKFSDDDLVRIVRAARRTSTAGPWPLIREQTVSDACYILLSGEAGVYVGQDRIAVVGPGEVIGESALRRGKLRNATVTTTGKAEVLHIARDDLDRLLDGVPALRATMDATVARHVPEAAGDPSWSRAQEPRAHDVRRRRLAHTEHGTAT